MFRAAYDEAHEIVPHLFLGSYEAARDYQFLSTHGVTHVVSVYTGAEPLFPGKLEYKCISLDDAPYEDLLSHFATTTRFIQRGLDAGGAVLVHCMAGISRSATIVIAYLMKTYNLTLSEAMDKVRAKRAIINPNRGFYQQLERYQTIKANTSESHKATRRYHIEREAVARNGIHSSHSHVHLRIPIQTSDASHAPRAADSTTTITTATTSGSQSQFRCKKCRTTLFNDEFILGHEPSDKKGGFHPRKVGNQAEPRYVIKNVSETKGPLYTDRRYVQMAVPLDSDSLHATCSSYFIEPMQWIAGSSDGSHEGRIDCFKCGTKLGSYDWSGLACSCSRWITPAFMVHKGKVDKIKAFM